LDCLRHASSRVIALLDAEAAFRVCVKSARIDAASPLGSAERLSLSAERARISK
jgi:hypothetical protein